MLFRRTTLGTLLPFGLGALFLLGPGATGLEGQEACDEGIISAVFG